MAPESHPKSTQIDHVAAQGRFIHRLYRFRALSENRRFFEGAPGRPKIDLGRPRAPNGRQREPKCSVGVGHGPRGRLAHVLVKKKTTEEQLVQDLTRHGPLARRILGIWRTSKVNKITKSETNGDQSNDQEVNKIGISRI